MEYLDQSRMLFYSGGWDPDIHPAKNVVVPFRRKPQTKDEWALVTASPLQGSTDSRAVLRLCHDNACLHLCVEVDRTAPVRLGVGAYAGAQSKDPAIPEDRDSVCFALDFSGAHTISDGEGRGILCVTAGGETAWFHHEMIPTLGSCFDPLHPEYKDRVAYLRVSQSAESPGFRVELSLHIEDLPTAPALDVSVQLLAEQSSETLFWSHSQETLYPQFGHSHINSVDWAVLTLENRQPACTVWRLQQLLDWIASPALQKGVWRRASQQALECAVRGGELLLSAPYTDECAVSAAARALEEAIAGLRWADERYPDPVDLPVQLSLPDPFRFFGSERRVHSRADWEERRKELLRLAEFYEYGHRPEPPDSMNLLHSEHLKPGDTETMSFGPWQWEYAYTCEADRFTVELRVQERCSALTFTVYLPEPDGQPAPIILSFDGDNQIYREAGFAVVKADPGTAGDIRTVDYVWGQRSGCFYDLFPYCRNGPDALLETGSEMAAAWCLSRVIDALERLTQPGERYSGLLDASRLAVTGFSIHGKYAFVSALYDTRISACIPGASGATGLSSWRFVYTGQRHCWKDTIYDSGDPAFAETVAFGTETLGNAIRHNRGRGNALFGRFLTPGNAYAREPGAYGYGLRLPFDQSCLAATMAGRAILVMNTPNDYNDGSVTDALTLDLLKPLYVALGYDAGILLGYNYREVCTAGDPHGTDEAQFRRTAAFLNAWFRSIPMDPETAERLQTNPFALPIADGRSVYDTYWGGYDAITGGWYSAVSKEHIES